MKNKHLAFLTLAALLTCGFAPSAQGTTLAVSATDEAMVLSGSPNLDFDGMGAIEFSANGMNLSLGNTEYGLMEFNSSSIASSLNSTYGGEGGKSPESASLWQGISLRPGILRTIQSSM